MRYLHVCLDFLKNVYMCLISKVSKRFYNSIATGIYIDIDTYKIWKSAENSDVADLSLINHDKNTTNLLNLLKNIHGNMNNEK